MTDAETIAAAIAATTLPMPGDRRCSHCRWKPALGNGLCGECGKSSIVRVLAGLKPPKPYVKKSPAALQHLHESSALAEQEDRWKDAPPDGFLFCFSADCGALVPADAEQREKVLRLGCSWALCPRCRDSVSKIRDERES